MSSKIKIQYSICQIRDGPKGRRPSVHRSRSLQFGSHISFCSFHLFSLLGPCPFIWPHFQRHVRWISTDSPIQWQVQILYAPHILLIQFWEIGLFEKSLSLFCHALSQVTFTANKSTSQTAQKKDYCEVMAIMLFLFCFEKKNNCIGEDL